MKHKDDIILIITEILGTTPKYLKQKLEKQNWNYANLIAVKIGENTVKNPKEIRKL